MGRESLTDAETARIAARAEAKADDVARDVVEHAGRIRTAEDKLDELVDETRGIRADIGRMPGKRGIDDEGAGALRMLCEIKQAQKRSARSHLAVGAGGSAVVAMIVQTVMGILSASQAARAGVPAPAPPVPVVAPAAGH